MEKTKDDKLKLFSKVYAKFRHSNFFSIIEDGYDYLTKQSYSIWNTLSDSTTKETMNDFDRDYKEYLTIPEILEICKKFLKDTFGEDSLKKFEKCIQGGNIELYDAEDDIEKDSHPVSNNIGPYYDIVYENQYDDKGYYINTNRHGYIEIPIKHNILDVYAIIHEFIHLSNDIYKGDRSSDRVILGESASITVEFILHEYLVEKNICPHDVHIPILRRLEALLKDSKILMEILTKYNKVTNDDELMNTTYDSSNTEENRDILNEYDKFCGVLKYYIGTVIAAINYKRYLEGEMTIYEIEDYNFYIDKFDGLDSIIAMYETLPKTKEVIESLNYLINNMAGQNYLYGKSSY